MKTAFTAHAGVEVPLICGAMYPCSNPELVAAVSEAGGLGIVQPMSLIYVYRHELRDGLRLIRSRTSRPIGFNAIVESFNRVYEERMRRWVDVALEEGVRFFVTALGDPRWVVERVKAVGGVVYHDVTERRFALKALDAGVDGLICVNALAGGHAGSRSPEALLEELGGLGAPLVCAGGVGDERVFSRMLGLGYAAAQVGTRFIATDECAAHDDYKRAILRARAEDITLTDRISGVPCAVIRTPDLERVTARVGPVLRALLRQERTKRLARGYLSLRSAWTLRRSNLEGVSYRDVFQAGKSVELIDAVAPAGEVVRRFASALE